jgi:hypothetical protein
MKWQDSILCKLKLKKLFFILNLKYRLPLYQEGYHMNYQQSLNAHIA